ncbi:HNH endonuclease [Bacillus zanthoxyli]
MEFLIIICVTGIFYLIFTECVFDYIKCNPEHEIFLRYMGYAFISLGTAGLGIVNFSNPHISIPVSLLFIITLFTYFIAFFSQSWLEDVIKINSDRVMLLTFLLSIPFCYAIGKLHVNINDIANLLSYITNAITIIFFGIMTVDNLYEHNKKVKKAAIEYHGLNCSVCDLNFYDSYGEIGKDFIEIHDTFSPIENEAQITRAYPILRLHPICPNCHAMLHIRKPPYSIGELKEIIKKQSER